MFSVAIGFLLKPWGHDIYSSQIPPTSVSPSLAAKDKGTSL